MGHDVCISSYLGLSSAIYSYLVAHRYLNIGLHSYQSMPEAALVSTLDLVILNNVDLHKPIDQWKSRILPRGMSSYLIF